MLTLVIAIGFVWFVMCDNGFKDRWRVSDVMADGDMTENIDRIYPGTFGAFIVGMNKTGENQKSLGNEINVARAGEQGRGFAVVEIVQSINQVTRITTDITSTSTERNSDIQQVNEAVRLINDVNQQNAAFVEQAAASAESLEEQTELLLANVAKSRIAENFLVSPAIQKLTTIMNGSQGAQDRANSQEKTILKNIPEFQVIQSDLEREAI